MKAVAGGNQRQIRAANAKLARAYREPKLPKRIPGLKIAHPVAAEPLDKHPQRQIDTGPMPILGYKPDHIGRQQHQLKTTLKAYQRNQAELDAMVNPLSRENRDFIAEGLTGYQEIRHPLRNPTNTGMVLGGIFPFGRVGKVAEEIRAAEAGVNAAREGEGLKGALAARKAAKAARRIPKMSDQAARHAHLLELSRQAASEPDVQKAMHEFEVKYLKPGETTPETGGAVGAKVRQAMRPDFSGMGKYEKIGAKADNPGLAELRKQQEELRGVQRSRKAGALHAAQEAAFETAHKAESPIKAVAKARGVLRGELPAKVFSGFDNLTHEEQLAVTEHIKGIAMRPHEKDNLLNAISEGLDGKVPTEGEQKLIERAFGVERPDVVSAIKAGGLKQALFNAMTIPRAIKSSGDLSWGLRQGLAAAVHSPKAWFDAFKSTPKAAFSERSAQAAMQAIHEHPYFPLLVKYGVPFTEIGDAAKGVANVSDKEEAIMSNWAEHLHEMPVLRNTPGVKQLAQGISKVVRASDRGYVIPLNKLRLKMGSQMLHQALENGWNLEANGGKLGKDLGEVVGALTGRGSLPKALEKHRATINALFFSPGLMSSRIQMLNPFWYARMEPFARKQALKSARNLAGLLTTVLFAAKMAGAHVETDPRNSDFGKIRIGNTRLDVAGGYSQYLTLYSRLGTQTTISSTTGKRTKLSGKSFGQSDWDLIQGFFENKLSPIPAEGVTLAKRNRFGQPLTPTGELGQMFSPLLWNDMYQLATAKGPGGGPKMAAATLLPDLFGVGVNNYSARPKKKGTGRGSSSYGSGGGYGGSSGYGDSGGYGSSGGYGG